MPRKNNPHSTPYVKPDYHSQNKLKNDDNNIVKQKVKLRTSLDIYNRLIHDRKLDLDLNNVKIGYSCKVLGNQEMNILDWTMIDKGGDIPMHHILYFVFVLNNGNKLIIWDRKTRLDRLYCSGNTNKQQSLSIILNSKKIKNIQSQKMKTNKKKKLKKNHYKFPNDQEEKKENKMMVTKMPKQILQNDEMIKNHFPRYPTTDDGFVQSFTLNDTQNWTKFLNHYGVVVLKVFTEKETDITTNAMWNELYQRKLELNKLQNDNRKIYKIDMNNPYTWNDSNFPKRNSKFLTDRPAFCKRAFLNRCCAKMYFIWKTIYKDEKLNVSVDNFGIQRGTKKLIFRDPTTNKKLINGNNHEQKKWRKNLIPHWDINPWQYLHWLKCGHYKYIYQGALALSEQKIEDGTHLTLPGCVNFLSKWCEKNETENNNPNRHTLSPNDNISKYMQPIPLRKGEMVIWNYGQLHATSKNYSDRMRLMQYIRMYPSQQKYIKRDHYGCQAILSKYKNDIDLRNILGNDLDEKSQKLLGLKSW